MSIRALRDLVTETQRKLPWIETLEDLRIVLEVGSFQETRTPLTCKLLLLADLGARATVARRLARLVAHHVVARHPLATDRRCVRIVLSSAARRSLLTIYRRLETNLADNQRPRPAPQPGARRPPGLRKVTL